MGDVVEAAAIFPPFAVITTSEVYPAILFPGELWGEHEDSPAIFGRSFDRLPFIC